jgi:hypothetical protein
METSQQYQQRIESYQEYYSKKKIWNIGRNLDFGNLGYH